MGQPFLLFKGTGVFAGNCLGIVGIMFVGGIDANINVSVGMEGAIYF